MRRVQLGIIGCGIAARELHLPALRKLTKKFRIAAVCNHTEPKAKSFSRLTGGVPYTLNYRDLLAMTEVEAVDIALPIDLNCRVVLDSLKAGKHVIVEKPIAAQLPEARAMVGFQRRFPNVMMVAENYRYRSIFRKAQEAIQRGVIGRVYGCLWNAFSLMTVDNKYAQTRWRRHHTYPGGFITDAGVHNIAALRMLFGELSVTGAFAGSVNPKIGTIDYLSMQYTCRGGVRGVLNLFFSANGIGENTLTIFGSTGSLVLTGGKLMVKRQGGKDRLIPVQDDSGFEAEFEDFHKAIITDASVVSTLTEGYRDFKTILDALRIARKGEVSSRISHG